MTDFAAILTEALKRNNSVAIVTIRQTQGSTPRETGATMLVLACSTHGTIGGGQLELHATQMARNMLSNGDNHLTLPLTLGPNMGQCCGGSVVLDMRLGLPADVAALEAQAKEQSANRPVVMIFGAGHTGKALAVQLAALPLRTILVDDRPEELANASAEVEKLMLEDPALAILTAPQASAYVIMTHSHALDYRLTEAALRRGDAAYVGLIGSDTKRARFLASVRRSGHVNLAPFICPIGGGGVADKRPEIIAALTAAELLLTLFGQRTSQDASHGASHGALNGALNDASCALTTSAKVSSHHDAA